ncbi:MAG: hypothetical protein ISN29_03010 [Gammaproteobacteria bacterium AqS3]|nr:hypothetical protein [Gammaproteobacteria bacterium AqS3]
MESRYPLMSVLCYKSDMSLEIHIRTPDSVSYNHHAYPKVEVRLPMSQMWLPKDSWQYANGGEDIIIKTSMASVEQLLRLIENRGRIEVAARYGAGNGETIEQIHSIGAEFLKHYGDKWMRECEG